MWRRLTVRLPSGILCLASWVCVPGDPLPASLNDILSDAQWYEQVANPLLTSPEQVDERAAQYERLLARLNAQEKAIAIEPRLKAKLEVATRLLTRFLDFARGGQLIFLGEQLAIQIPGQLSPDSRRQALQRIQDAHARMRRKWQTQLQLDLPPGLLFVKLYTSREQMARDYGLGPEAAGVAFPCRYIAVALPGVERPVWRRMRQYIVGEEFQQTAAHELIHSFCFITLGYHRAGRLPRWFMEGLALDLSGQRRVRTALEGPGGWVIRDVESTQEYQEFKQLFRFVRHRYGPARLYEFARMSLQQGSVDQSLPDILNLANETAFIGAAVSWYRDKERFQQRLIVIALGGILAAFLILRGRWRRLSRLAAVGIVWLVTASASVSPYYVHTLLWWVPAALSLPLAYLIAQYVRQWRTSEPTGLRLIVVSDWPRLDERMEPWPYDEVSLAEIVQADAEGAWGWGEREIKGSQARRIRAFLEAQSTNSFYFQGRAYRVWYE